MLKRKSAVFSPTFCALFQWPDGRPKSCRAMFSSYVSRALEHHPRIEARDVIRAGADRRAGATMEDKRATAAVEPFVTPRRARSPKVPAMATPAVSTSLSSWRRA